MTAVGHHLIASKRNTTSTSKSALANKLVGTVSSKEKITSSQSLDGPKKTSSAGPATASSATNGWKRKSPSAIASSAEQPVAGAKKAKTIPSANPSTSNNLNPSINPPQRPTPRQVLKLEAQAGSKVSPSVSWVAQEDEAVPQLGP